jgi:hypothetical protein
LQELFYWPKKVTLIIKPFYLSRTFQYQKHACRPKKATYNIFCINSNHFLGPKLSGRGRGLIEGYLNLSFTDSGAISEKGIGVKGNICTPARRLYGGLAGLLTKLSGV